MLSNAYFIKVDGPHIWQKKGWLKNITHKY